MPKDGSIYQLKITLNDSRPKIWRRILVPAGYSFFDLHCAIQDAMGWTESHLHAFRIVKAKPRDMITIELPNFDDLDSLAYGETRDERSERIADYFGKTIKQCIYEYDFGDGWEHTVLLERQLPSSPGAAYPQCIAGENAGPPEDCGGIGGYEHLQKVLKNPKHEEHDEMLEWLAIDSPDEFDPHDFDPSEVEFSDPKDHLKQYEMFQGM